MSILVFFKIFFLSNFTRRRVGVTCRVADWARLLRWVSSIGCSWEAGSSAVQLRLSCCADGQRQANDDRDKCEWLVCSFCFDISGECSRRFAYVRFYGFLLRRRSDAGHLLAREHWRLSCPLRRPFRLLVSTVCFPSYFRYYFKLQVNSSHTRLVTKSTRH